MAREFHPADGPGRAGRGELGYAALPQAHIDLAAGFRMAARLGLEEGICHRFSGQHSRREAGAQSGSADH